MFVSFDACGSLIGGERDQQVVADERFWFAREVHESDFWWPDLAILRTVSTRIVVGIGEDSASQACDRTSRALGIEPTMFPGDHVGFAEDPQASRPGCGRSSTS
jgi:hypothetical protein